MLRGQEDMRASNAPKAGRPSYYPLGTPEACAGGVAAVRRVERARRSAPAPSGEGHRFAQAVCVLNDGGERCRRAGARAACVGPCGQLGALGGRRESLVRVAACCRLFSARSSPPRTPHMALLLCSCSSYDALFLGIRSDDWVLGFTRYGFLHDLRRYTDRDAAQ